MSLMSPEFTARMIIRGLERTKSNAFLRLIVRDDPTALAQANAGDDAIDVIIAHWQKLIDAGNPTKLRSALDRYSAAMAQSDEDDLLERADEIRARRSAEAFKA